MCADSHSILEPLSLTPEVRAEIADLPRRTLSQLFSQRSGDDLPSILKHIGKVPRVNVTLRSNGHLIGSMAGGGTTLGEQIRDATVRAASDTRFRNELRRDDLSNLFIEIWLQESAEPVTADDIATGTSISLGFHGVEIEIGEKTTYFKPSVAITKRYLTASALFNALCRKADVAEESWKNPSIIKRRSIWRCIASATTSHEIELKGARHQSKDEQVENLSTLREWLSASVTYLWSHQRLDGKPDYLYDPIRNNSVDTPANIVRIAGCLYGLSEALGSGHLIDSTRCLETAIHLADRLVSQLSYQAPFGLVLRAGIADETPKLGASALLCLAIQRSPQLFQRYGEYATQLLDSLSRAQRGDGRFLTQFGIPAPDPRTSNYSSGQALLCFAQAASAGSQTALEACDRAFQAYRSDFQAGPTAAFIGWHLDVWSRLALLTGDERYRAFCSDQADWLRKRQIRKSENPFFIGGYKNPTRQPTFSATVFVEAEICAFRVAKKFADEDRKEKLRADVLRGLKFCGRLRLEAVPDAYFPEPERRLGGFSMSFVDLNVRCDAVQHFITMLCKAIESYDDLTVVIERDPLKPC